VFPSASFCTIGGGDDNAFFPRIPGLPESVTCLGAAADGWLALDCTDDVFRRTPLWDKFCYDTGNFVVHAKRDVKHRHTYLLCNPFSGETVPLPELDALVGHVAETFEIRKVLMRSSSPDDVVAVTTNNWDYNIILCCPGKGRWVVPYLRVCDVAFHGDKLYGITPEEELVACDISQDEDGRPIVNKYKRVIMQPLADGEEDPWSWMYDDDASDQSCNGEEKSDGDDSEDGNDDDLSSIDEDEESSDEYSSNGDDMVPDGEDIGTDDKVSYEPKDYIAIRRHLVESREGQDLLMVRHHTQAPPFSDAYTRKVEVFKADIEGGKWVPVTTDALAQGEALFLSRSFCKCTRAYGDIKEGFVYFMDMNDVFDTRSMTRSPLRLPPQWRQEDKSLLTWFFPPELAL
jgi:hypothetical protein